MAGARERRVEGRPAAVPASARQSSGIVIFSDLDGTLLDADYSWRAARPALALCRRLGVKVVLVSSKTRAEMEPLHRRLDLRTPLVSENGCGVFFPAGLPKPSVPYRRVDAWWRVGLGRPYREVVHDFRRLRHILGWQILGFSDLNANGIAALTGLAPAAARRAARREFDEPFTIVGPPGADLGRMEREAKAMGLVLRRGGSFHHLHSGPGKGAAVEMVVSWLRGLGPVRRTVAMGDAPNDFDMLAAADLPVLIGSGRRYPGLSLPGLRRTALEGPAGWNQAVLEILGQGAD